MQPHPPQRPIVTERQQGSWLGVILASILGMAVVVALLFLTLGSFGPVLLIGAIIFAITGFHYFVWGWWIRKVIVQEAEAEEI